MVQQKIVFISYNRRDFPFVRDMHTLLENNSYEVWLDLQDIQGGMTWWDETRNAILDTDFFLVVLSKYSAMSEYVGKEVKYALAQGKQVIPVLLQEADGFPTGLEHFQWIDARQHFEHAMQQLLNVLSSTALAESAHRYPRMRLKNPVSKSWRAGWFRDPMPAAMSAVGIAVAISAGVQALLGLLIYLYFGSDYLEAVKQAYSTQTNIMTIAPALDTLIGLASLFVFQAGSLLWVARKLGHRELPFGGTLALIVTLLIVYLLVLIFERGWYFRWFVGGDVFVLIILAISPVAEAVAIILLATQPSARRYMPSAGYYPLYEKLGLLR